MYCIALYNTSHSDAQSHEYPMYHLLTAPGGRGKFLP